MKIVWVKHDALKLIQKNKKKIEVRLLTPFFKSIQYNDKVIFTDNQKNETKVLIKNIKTYQNIEELLKNEKLKDMNLNMRNKFEYLKMFEKLYNKNRINKNMIVAFHFKVIE